MEQLQLLGQRRSAAAKGARGFTFLSVPEDEALVDRIVSVLTQAGIGCDLQPVGPTSATVDRGELEWTNVLRSLGGYVVLVASAAWGPHSRRLGSVWPALKRLAAEKPGRFMLYDVRAGRPRSLPPSIRRLTTEEATPEQFALTLIAWYLSDSGMASRRGDPADTAQVRRFAAEFALRPQWALDGETVVTGYMALDDALEEPLRVGGLYLVAGRPSIGKTTMALNVANNCAHAGIPVVLLTSGGRSEKLVRCLLSIRSGVPLEAFEVGAGQLDGAASASLSRAVDSLQCDPLYIVDLGQEPSLDKTVCEVWHLARTVSPRLIVADLDLRRLGASGAFGAPGRVSASSAMSMMGWLARETSAAVVVTYGLGRAPESRPDHRPRLADLRGGIRIAEHARAVLLLYRPDAYEGRGEEDVVLDMEVVVVKPGHKPKEPVLLRFERDKMRLGDYLGDAWDAAPGA